MKTKYFRYLTLSTLATILLCSSSFGQQTFKINPSDSKLIVSGTSTVHDWEMEAENFSGEATISMNENSIKSINEVDFECPVESIKSNNKIMNNKTQKALNSNKHPEIRFRFDNPNNGSLTGSKPGVKGTLTINDTKKEVEVDFTYEKLNQNQIKIKGEVPLKMSDFDVEPPTAMLGTLKTDDEIKVIYEIVLEK